MKILTNTFPLKKKLVLHSKDLDLVILSADICYYAKKNA